MAEAHVAHVVATVRRAGELAREHDQEHRTAVIAIHRDALPELAAAAAAAQREAVAPSPSTMPRTGRR